VSALSLQAAATLGESSTKAPEEFSGKIGTYYKDSVESPSKDVKAPHGAPNILIWLLDDAGFAHVGSFGGLVATPTLDALAANGLRYNDFNSTGVCSPSRAALLTGRNHHAVGMGAHAKTARGFPGYNARIPKSAASLAKVLTLNGYATYAFGKWDQLPAEHANPAGPFDYWPTGQGFEHFYGFLAAEADQFSPQVYQEHTPIEPGAGKSDYQFTADIANRAIAAVRSLRAAAPKKPFFMYWATGAVHAPHHAPKEYIDKYKGKFDAGWDVAREQILERQKALGVVPKDTVLPPKPSELPDWSKLSPDERKMHARAMEAFAGYLEFADHEFGRILEELRQTGQLENTLVLATSDNGASSEGGPDASFNTIRFTNGLNPSVKDNIAHLGKWGGPETSPHFSAAWALAGNTPFKYYKQTMYAGGVRVPMIVSWPREIKQAGQIRHQFHHLNDIMPTVLEAAKINLPDQIDGVAQRPLDGASMVYSFANGTMSSPKAVQYFELWGNRAIWSDGWKAIVNHRNTPWMMTQAQPFTADRWELYNVAHDINEMQDLAAKNPRKLAEMTTLFDREAKRNQVYPLKDVADGYEAIQRGIEERIRSVNGHFVYSGKGSERIPEELAPPVNDRSYTISATIDVPQEGGDGVIVSMGGQPAGYSLFVRDGRPTFALNYFDQDHRTFAIKSQKALRAGVNTVRFAFQRTGPYRGRGQLFLNDEKVGQLDMPTLRRFAPINETFDVGADRGSAVSSDYTSPFVFSGNIHSVEFAIPPAD
jgi:arylsulfatase